MTGSEGTGRETKGKEGNRRVEKRLEKKEKDGERV